jgi:hypothetical protein
MRLTTSQLITELSKIVDPELARLAVENYVEMQKRFLAGDWKPSELNGGAVCESISRCLYQLDTSRVAHKKSVKEIRDYLIDEKNTHPHNLKPKDRNHISRTIELAYKFRSDRGVAHISIDHDANLMDSMLIVHLCKWIFAEFLRLSWNGDRKVIAETISQIVQIEHALIHELDGIPLVLATNISAKEEILLLLNHAPTNCLSKEKIKEQAPLRSPQAVAGAITQLKNKKEIRIVNKDEIAITPTGQKKVMEEIIPKINH